MSVYHAKTDPDLLTRIKQMLGSPACATHRLLHHEWHTNIPTT